MHINKELAIKYANILLPHFHLSDKPVIYKKSEKPGYDRELIFVMDKRTSNYTREHDSDTIRFLFGVEESLLQMLDRGVELDITEDVNAFLDNYITPGKTIHSSLD